MPRKSTFRPRFDAETIRACGGLVRCIAGSRSFRGNVLAERLTQLDREDIERTVRCAFDELSSRQRAIVMRCDLRGERYGLVAKALHVSERHLFRERRAALSAVAARLLGNPVANKKRQAAIAPDAFAVHLGLSDVLGKSGNWQSAAAVLEDLARNAGSLERRGSVEVRLAKLYRDADAFSQAKHHADVARRLAARLSGDGGVQRVEAGLAFAGVVAGAGNWKTADHIVEQSIAELRPLIDGNVGTRVPKALADALLLKAEMLVDNGGIDRALTLANEASAIVGHGMGDLEAEISARAMAATIALLLAKDPMRCEEEVLDCYRGAADAGLVRGSLIIAVHLATYYRLNGRFAEALALLTPLRDAARIAGTGWVQGALLVQLAQSSLDAGSLDAAIAYTDELAERATLNPLEQAAIQMTRARVSLVRNDFARALEAAGNAEALYISVGLARFVGLSGQVRAQALYGLGERDRAREAVARAIDSLQSTAHPRQLAAAYWLMAKITGSPRYARAARRVLAQ